MIWRSLHTVLVVLLLLSLASYITTTVDAFTATASTGIASQSMMILRRRRRGGVTVVSKSATTTTTIKTFAIEASSSATLEEEEEEAIEEDEEMDAEAIFERLGIEPGQLALGVRPGDVLKYIGTRDELIAKTRTDLPKLTPEQAGMEVDKFLLDPEMVDLYIRYQKEVEKDPNFKVPDANDGNNNNDLFSVRNIAIAYGTFLLVSRGPDLVRGYIADRQLSGTWQPTGISFVDHWIDTTGADAAAGALVRASSAAATTAAAVVEPVAVVVPAP